MRIILTLAFLASTALAQEPAAPSSIAAVPTDNALHSSLLLPKESGKAMPVVLMLSGSGPTDRNSNSPVLPGKNNSLQMLAEGLAENGIASLRYDKRGVGESAKAMVSDSDIRFETYVDDAVALRRSDSELGSGVSCGRSRVCEEGGEVGEYGHGQIQLAE